MLGAVVFGHEQMQAAIQAINELAEEAGKPAWDWQPPAKDEALIARVAELAEADLREAFAIKQKQARSEAPRRDLEDACSSAWCGAEAPDRRQRGEGHLLRPRIEDRARPDPRRRAAHRRPRHAHRAPDHRPRRRAAAHPRLGAVHPRRNPGAGDRDARHRRATSRSSTRWRASTASASCCTTTCRRTPPARPAASARPSAARSATAASPSARWSACCRRRRSSATRCAWCRRSPSRTARPRWPRCAAAASR